MEELLQSVAERAARYLDSLQNRNVAPTPDALQALAQFDEAFPNGPSDRKLLFRCWMTLDLRNSGYGGLRFFGFVVGGSLRQHWRRTGWLAHGIRMLH